MRWDHFYPEAAWRLHVPCYSDAGEKRINVGYMKYIPISGVRNDLDFFWFVTYVLEVWWSLEIDFLAGTRTRPTIVQSN